MGSVFGGGDPYQQQPQQYLGGDPNYFSGGPGSQPFYAGDDYGTAGPGGQGTDQNYGGGGLMYANEGGSPAAGGGGILDWLGSEKGQRAMQQLGGFSAGMLQGSAPSLTPRNFSTGLGAGMAGMQQAGSQYYTDALRRAQAQQAQAQVANLTAWDAAMQREAARATGLPPGYMPGGSGMSTPAVAQQAPASAGGSGGGGAPTMQQAVEYAGQQARALGIDPDIAGRVVQSEYSPSSYQSQVRTKSGGQETSYGPLQLYTGGGLGNNFIRDTGKDPRDPANWQATVDYGLQHAAQNGWGAFHGAARAGIGNWDGIGAGNRAMAGQPVAAPRLADTAFQMPSNMAAGLGGPAAATGILPQAAAAGPLPAVTQPGALASGLRSPVAPIVTTPQTAATAPTVPPAERAPAAPLVAEGAGNLATVNRNLEDNPNYYQGKLVVLQPTGNKLDKLPDQIDRIKEAGGQPVLQAAIDSNAKQNSALARIAAKKGVPYREAREGSGSSFPVSTTTGTDPGAGQPYTPAPIVGASAAPAPPPSGTQPASVPSSPAPAGTLVQGGALPPAAPPAGAPGGLVRGTAPGMPTPPPQPLPATPAPSPAAAAGPPGPPPPPVPGAAVAGPNAMPGSIAPPPVAAPPPPLPMPNLGQVQPPGAGGLPPYDVEAARRAQVLSIAGAATGHQVPAYLAEQAGLPNKAVEQQWARQAQLYGAQLEAMRDQWKSMDADQKAATAQRYNLDTKTYENQLNKGLEDYKAGRFFNPQTQQMEQIPGYNKTTADTAGAVADAQKAAEVRAAWDTPKDYTKTGSDGTPYTYVSTPRREAGGADPPPIGSVAPGTPPGAPSAAPAPGGTQPPLRQTGLAPGRQAELTGQGEQLKTFVNKVHTDAETARTQAPDLEVLARVGPNIDWAGPGAPYKQMFNRATASAFGVNTENVASYEMAQQLMGGMLRKALRASDSNPTEKQQTMMLATFPTPESSKQGFQQGVSYMQGINDWQVFREEALRNWTATHNNSADGFQENFKLSAIPFVVQKMPQATRDSYFAQLKATDPSGKTLHRLADQMQAIAQSNYNYSY